MIGGWLRYSRKNGLVRLNFYDQNLKLMHTSVAVKDETHESGDLRSHITTCLITSTTVLREVISILSDTKLMIKNIFCNTKRLTLFRLNQSSKQI
jgi:hypothetical protein